MALKYPTANANWSLAANWNGGTKPVAGDDVRANGKTVTIDEDVNLGATGQLSTAASGAAIAGGAFVVTTNRTITANVIGGTAHCLQPTVSGITTTLNGNVTGGASASILGVYISSSIVNVVFNVNGNVLGGTASDTYGLYCASVGSIITVIGNVNGSATAPSGASGIFFIAGTVNIVGNVTGGNVANSNTGVTIQGAVGNTLLNIIGNVLAGVPSGGFGILGNGGSIIITGNITATIQVGFSIVSGNVTINGNVLAASNYGINSSGSANNVTVNGSSTASDLSYGSYNSANGYMYVKKAIGAQGSGGGSTCGVYGGVITGTTIVEEIEYGPQGQPPIQGYVKFSATYTVKKVKIRLTDNTYMTFTELVSGILPANSDVRFGVNFNSGNSTGSLRVAPSASVLVGVLTDNTVGTAALNAATIGAAVVAAILADGANPLNPAVLGPQVGAVVLSEINPATLAENIIGAIQISAEPVAERLRNCSTVATTSAQIAAAG